MATQVVPHVHGTCPQSPAAKFVCISRAAHEQEAAKPTLRRCASSELQLLLRLWPNPGAVGVMLNGICCVASHHALASSAAKSTIRDPCVQHGTKDRELSSWRDLAAHLPEVGGCSLRPAARQGVDLPVSELVVEEVLEQSLPPLWRWLEMCQHCALKGAPDADGQPPRPGARLALR